MRTMQDCIKKEIKDAEAVIYETKLLLDTLKQNVNELELKLEFKEQLVEVLKRNLDGHQTTNEIKEIEKNKEKSYEEYLGEIGGTD